MYENEVKQWALAQKVAYLPCPRCGGKMHENLMHNSLSRHAEIHVCPVCGMDEAYRDFNDKGTGSLTVPIKDWFIIKKVFTPNRFTYDEALKGTFIETHHSIYISDEQLCEIAEMIVPGWGSEWYDNVWADDADLEKYEDIKRVIYSGTPIYIHDSVSDTTVQFTKQDLLNGILKWIEEGEQADDYMVVHAPEAASQIRFHKDSDISEPNVAIDFLCDFHADRILQYAIFGEIKYEA